MKNRIILVLLVLSGLFLLACQEDESLLQLGDPDSARFGAPPPDGAPTNTLTELDARYILKTNETAAVGTAWPFGSEPWINNSRIILRSDGQIQTTNTTESDKYFVYANFSGLIDTNEFTVPSNSDASGINSGTLADARLSTNVSLLNQTIDASELTDGTVTNGVYYWDGANWQHGTLPTAINSVTGNEIVKVATVGGAVTLTGPEIVTNIISSSSQLTSVKSGNTYTVGLTNVPVVAGTWKVFYSNGNTNFTELALGASNTTIISQGAANAPIMDSPGNAIVGSAWQSYYANTTGNFSEFALGASNTVYVSQGTAAAPIFDEVADILVLPTDRIPHGNATSNMVTTGGFKYDGTNLMLMVGSVANYNRLLIGPDDTPAVDALTIRDADGAITLMRDDSGSNIDVTFMDNQTNSIWSIGMDAVPNNIKNFGIQHNASNSVPFVIGLNDYIGLGGQTNPTHLVDMISLNGTAHNIRMDTTVDGTNTIALTTGTTDLARVSFLADDPGGDNHGDVYIEAAQVGTMKRFFRAAGAGLDAQVNPDKENMDIYLYGTTQAVFFVDASADTGEVNGLFRIRDSFEISGAGELTIAAGAITLTEGTSYVVDTEADAATDDLDTISAGTTGQILILRASNTARTVVIKDGTGNIQTEGDFSMDNAQDTIILMYAGSNWLELSRSNNGT